MGEAKRRKLMAVGAFARLDDELRKLGIETDRIAFYDSEDFLRCERKDPSFLEKYARWVNLRPRDETYDNHVRAVVPKLTKLLATALKKDGMQGGCVTASGMMSRMLDRLGIWSFGVSGCLTLEVEKQNLWRGLATIGDPDFPNAALGHAWVIAPPFQVADASLSLQRFESDPILEYIPDILLVDGDGKMAKPDVTDVVSAQVRARYEARGMADSKLHYRLEPRLLEFGRDFPAMEVRRGDLRMKYVPVAVRQTDVALELINSQGAIGRTGREIWQEIAPVLAS